MSEKAQIIFMQVRLIRLASVTWRLPMEKVLSIFHNFQVFEYIEACYGIFHCEGDEVILTEITEYLHGKGMTCYAGVV